MSTLVKTYNFDSDGGGFVFTSGGKSTGVWQSTGGNTGGCWNIDTLGRNNTDDCYIELTTTWESLGIPSGSTINQISSSSYDWRCSIANVATLYGVGALEVHNNTPTLEATLSTELNGTITTSYAARTGGTVSIPVAIQASSTIIRIRLNFHLDVGNDKNAQLQVLIDNLSFTIDYSVASVPVEATIVESDSLLENQSVIGLKAGAVNDSSSLLEIIGVIALLQSNTNESAELNDVNSSIKSTADFLEDSLSIEDTANITLLSETSLDEVINVVDFNDVSLIFDTHLDESVEISESIDAVVSAINYVQENLESTDFNSSLLLGNVLIAETGNLLESNSSVKQANPDIAENSNLTDLLNVVKITDAFIEEVIEVIESTECSNVTEAFQGEFISLNENQSATITSGVTYGDVIETIELVDTQDLQNGVVSDCLENISIVEQLSATVIRNSYIIEQGNSTDLQGTTKITLSEIVSSIALTDTFNVNLTLLVNVSEVGALSDLVILDGAIQSLSIEELTLLDSCSIDIVRNLPSQRILGKLNKYRLNVKIKTVELLVGESNLIQIGGSVK